MVIAAGPRVAADVVVEQEETERAAGRRSRRLEGLGPSMIRRMGLRNLALHGPGRAINLAGGIPDFAPPEALLRAAAEAVDADCHQYPPPAGIPALQQAIARVREPLHRVPIDPETEITVACGATESLAAALLAVTDPGDEVVVVEPAYDGYPAACRLVGAVPRFARLRPPGWRLDGDELRRAFGPRTRAVILNTPHNPTGRVLTPGELEAVARCCREFDAVAIADEVYEHLVFEGQHRPIAALPGMRERTITISGASKSFSVTGWRLGWLIAEPGLSEAVRAAHDLLTVGAAHPLQVALTAALSLPPEYYRRLAAEYRARRDQLLQGLRELGFAAGAPEGAFYVLAGHAELGAEGDLALAERLVERAAVAAVPISSFYDAPHEVPALVRMTFAKRAQTIERALAGLRAAVAGAA